MSLFRGEELAAPNIDVPIIVKSASNKTEIGAIIDATAQAQYRDTYAGVTLTEGDVPLFAYTDTDGDAHVLVMADNDTVALRS